MPVNLVAADAATCIRFLPEIILTVVGTLLMVLDPILQQAVERTRSATSASSALLAALGGAVYAYSQPGPAFGGMLMVDGFATFFRVLVIVVGHPDGARRPTASCERQDAETGEYHALLLFSIVGPVPDGRRQRPDHGLHRPGDLLHRQLHPGRLPARRQARQRGGAEVLPAGLVRHGASSCTASR